MTKMAIWIKTTDDGLQIRWAKKGYPIDIFRADTFVDNCGNIIDFHEFGWPRKIKRGIAKFVKTVDDRIAILDYSDVRVRKENVKEELDIGVMKIFFANDKCCSVKEICWIDENGNEERNAACTSWDLLPNLGKKFIIPKESDVPREMVTRKERQHQTRFRDMLLQIYENTCCISLCNIPDALEAAHIIFSSDENSFDPRNGLLLRADLHRLFDKSMFGIDPRSRKIRLNEILANNPQYSHFNNKKIREAQPKDLGPAEEALTKRWKQFKHNI